MGKKYFDHLGNEFDSLKEMCKAYGISVNGYYYRINAGYNLEETLTKALLPNHMSCKDHLGNEFASVSAMCNHYGISISAYCDRIDRGFSVQEALTLDTRPVSVESVDHLGNVFPSQKEMCKHYNINDATFRKRISNGWSLEDALTKGIGCTDHLGNYYKSKMEMCRHYNIDKGTLRKRLAVGYSLQEALELKTTQPQGKKCLDHLGNEYPSIRAMCREYGITDYAFQARIKAGYSVKDALTKPLIEHGECFDHLGIRYDNATEMCNHYNISYTTYIQRIKRGWPVEEALMTKAEPRKKKTKDHTGHVFSSATEMCRYYGVDQSVYKRRRQLGWSIEDALFLGHKTTGKECYDHKGNRYESIAELCRAYGINFSTYKGRRRYNWSMEDLLTTIVGNECYDHKGNKYVSFKEMCEAYGVSYVRFLKRIGSYGWTIEEALTIPRNCSLGEARITSYLDKHNIEYYHDITIKRLFKELNCMALYQQYMVILASKLQEHGYDISIQRLSSMRFDFSLIRHNNLFAFIEFDGEQHFKWVDMFFDSLEQFVERQGADKLKTAFSDTAHIPLLRIRFDQVESIPYMIDDLLKNPHNYIKSHNTFLTNDEYWQIYEEMPDIAYTG